MGAALPLVKASQSFPSADGKGVESVFSGGVYLGKNTSQSASVRAKRVRAAGCGFSKKRPRFFENV